MLSAPYKYGFVIFLTAAAVLSCSKVPRGVLPEKKMKEVWIDMQLAESIINTDHKTYPDSAHRIALFKSVFRKHNVTQALYDSSLVWYGENLDMLMTVYDLALSDIDKEIFALGDVSLNPPLTENIDSSNIWPRRSYITLQPEALFNGATFDIKPEKEYLTGSVFILSMNVWGVREGMAFTPEVRIAAQTPDTTLIINEKIDHDGYREIILKTPALKSTQRLYGYIRMDNADHSYYKVFIDDLKLIRYNYGSLALKETVDTAGGDSE
ncbi:MAG: DUF4296 domain-containing protein [Tannerellaceae bacterium]|jgi:hypothetical protein|nr:DUF4296 domain-containing protein [Tannerellaceae bacterium]